MKKDPTTQSLMHRLQALAVKAGVPTQELRIDFILERLVARFVEDSELRKGTVFKGGFVSNRVYQSDRYTRDVDLSCYKLGLEGGIETLKSAVRNEQDDGLRFAYRDQSPIMGLEGTRLRFEASMGAKDSKTASTVDVTADVVITPVGITKEVSSPTLLKHGTLKWNICAAEITVAEKIVGLLTRTERNSRGKDIYDLFRLLPQCDGENLAKSLKMSSDLAGKSMPEDLIQSLRKIDTTSLRENWQKALRYRGPKIGFDVAWNGTLDLLNARLGHARSSDSKSLREKETQLLKKRVELGYVGTDRDALYGLGGYPRDANPTQKKLQKELESELRIVRDALTKRTKTQEKGLGRGRRRP